MVQRLRAIARANTWMPGGEGAVLRTFDARGTALIIMAMLELGDM